MLEKKKLRKKYFKIRKNNYFEINNNFFKPLITKLKKIFKKDTIYLSLYYPSNYEVNTIKLFNLIKLNRNFKILLPSILKKNNMNFYEWNNLDPLKVNKYGMLEPITVNKPIVPNVILVPLLAFDEFNHRLGYGKGYYDKFLNKYIKLNKNILTIGVAFSFQKYNKLPATKFDVKLNYILTEKGMR